MGALEVTYLIGCLMCIIPIIVIKKRTGITYWEMMQPYVIVTALLSFFGLVILIGVCVDLKE